MYVTRPFRLYNNSPEAAYEPPPEGPNSGILVIHEAEDQATCCWGLCKTSRLYNLPFPQNRRLKVEYRAGVGDDQRTYRDYAFFIPIINQPLSANQYYVIRASGRQKGEACRCSKEEEKITCCFCSCAVDVEPTPFDYRDIYQQIEVVCRKNKFQGKAVASDGYAPRFLRRKGLQVYTSVPSNYHLDEALGLDASLRMRMPVLDFEISTKQSAPVVVGKWYCPFMFVKEGDRLKDQMKSSMFYLMTLEQFWEQIYACENYSDQGKVEVSVSVRTEMAMMEGVEVAEDDMQVTEGVVWFKPVNTLRKGLGLSLAIWERMRWEQDRQGWVGGDEKVGRVERVDEYRGQNGWKKFGCYVLVERFALRRMDGSIALTYDFKHINKTQTIWE